MKSKDIVTGYSCKIFASKSAFSKYALKNKNSIDKSYARDSILEIAEELNLPATMEKLYYAVRRGFETGIYPCAEMALAQTEGFQSPEMKRFKDFNTAVAWLNEKKVKARIWDNIYQGMTVEDFLNHTEKATRKAKPSSAKKKTAIAYTDGCFNTKTNFWGYGVVLFNEKAPNDVYRFSGSGIKLRSTQNVTGEIMGAIHGIQAAIDLGYDAIDVHYDFAGVEEFDKCDYSKSEIATYYRSQLAKFRKKIDVSFTKVKAHSGNQFNNMADRLAKGAVGIIP